MKLIRGPRDLTGRVSVPAAEHASAKWLCLDFDSKCENRKPNHTDNAFTGAVGELPNRDLLAHIPGEGFEEELISMECLEEGNALHLNIRQVTKKHSARRVRDILPETVGIASER